MARIRSLAHLANAETENNGVERLEVIEASISYIIPQPILSYAAGETADQQAWNDLFLSEVEGISPEIAVYKIDGCFVTPNAAVITHSGWIVRESLYPYTWLEDVIQAFSPYLSNHDSDPPNDIHFQTRNISQVRDPIFFAREHGEAGYFHWIHSVLPRAAIYAKLGKNGRKLAVAITSDNYISSLEMVGWKPDELLIADGNTQLCNSLIMTTPMVVPDVERSGGFFERPLRAARTLRSLRSEDKSLGRRLFISRGDALIRRLLNEPEVIKELEALGVEPVILTGMSIQDQVNYFAAAELVISMHGAGLANVAFMEPGNKVIEILAPDRLWPTYRGVAARSGLKYAPYVGRRDGALLPNDSDISLDPSHFASFVAEVIAL